MPSVPPVTQKNLKARLHSTWLSASVRMPKKMRVWRTHTKPNSADTNSVPMRPPRMHSSIDWTPRSRTMNATV